MFLDKFEFLLEKPNYWKNKIIKKYLNIFIYKNIINVF